MNDTRRSFLKKAAILGFPTIIPASARGADGTVAPSNRIVMAGFGWGMQGPHNISQFMNQKDVQVVAICDLDQQHLQKGVDAVNNRYSNKDCKGYKDFREVMAREDIDAVSLSLPDTWHAIVAIAAANAKKDIWGEKPLARTIREQQAIVKAVQANQRIWQTGSWQRSDDNFRIGAEIVRNGLIGKVTEVLVGLPAGHNDFAGTRDKMSVTPPPAHLDYDMWIGPSQMEDYIEGRVHKNWRWNYNIGGGQLLDWIGHHGDIAHWGMDCDQTGGPVEMEATGEFPDPKAPWNTATKYKGVATYHNGVKVTIAGGHSDVPGGTKWIGTDGWVHVNRGHFDCSNPDFKKIIQVRGKDGKATEKFTHKELADDVAKVRLTKTSSHWGELVECIKSRKPTITPVETAHHSAIPGHLVLISMLVKRKIKWDPVKEEIVGDDEAAKLLGRDYRGPWKLG